MDQSSVLELFTERGALLSGHFLLSSGLHSAKYLQCALVLQYPKDAESLGEHLAKRFYTQKIDLVVAPALGGVIIGHEVARNLSVRAIFTEREAGQMQLRRGFEIKAGEKVLVIEDVITTGKSTREVIEVVTKLGGEVVGNASIIDRSAGKAELPFIPVSLAALDVATYSAENCPMCQEGLPLVKPGSRQTSDKSK
ncbi:MAG: orotate phosphoribosyltransferase [Blastocatellia bacterium]|nr:orotate phosphoribosyltransferase [Blastocatellia bacterium]MBL8195020.1 orotate phosphoribosyltransferase [Blastocatellia bacterium]MBN8724630.1 orotate phosphoribosyltransferase [Acidobacteriota bacterium]